jgi:hypothetical protein
VLVKFQARINPFIVWLSVPAFLLAAYGAWAHGDDLSNVTVAWLAAIFLLLVAVTLRERVSYIYYVVILLPGIYLAVVRLFSQRWMPRLATLGYGVLVVAAFVDMYPFRSWGGR